MKVNINTGLFKFVGGLLKGFLPPLGDDLIDIALEILEAIPELADGDPWSEEDERELESRLASIFHTVKGITTEDATIFCAALARATTLIILAAQASPKRLKRNARISRLLS